MELDYRTKGTCASNIHVVLDGRKVKKLSFSPAAQSAICRESAASSRAWTSTDVIARVRGIRCGMKPTSCPDQLARALEQAKEQLDQ